MVEHRFCRIGQEASSLTTAFQVPIAVIFFVCGTLLAFIGVREKEEQNFFPKRDSKASALEDHSPKKFRIFPFKKKKKNQKKKKKTFLVFPKTNIYKKLKKKIIIIIIIIWCF